MTSQSALPSVALDFEHLRADLSHLPFPAQFDECSPLAGDASNRRYYRLRLREAPVASLILMQLADPEGFKASEEAVSGSEESITELPFINVLKHLQAVGVSVPSLQYFDESAGLLFLEDFGDVTLAQACADSDAAQVERYYEQAIDTLVHLHLQASHPTSSPCLAFSRSFDVPLYLWEFDHFLEYGIVARHGKPMCADDYLPVRDAFHGMAKYLATQPMVFSHRDYHSRNLMVDGDRLGVIDFQDALMGPVTYDLASLLRDSYMALDESLIDRMIDRYCERMRQGLPVDRHASFLLDDPAEFRRLFDCTSIQRNLKAAGRFVYIDRVKHNPNFLSSIPRTLSNVRANLLKYPEFESLLTHLSPYIPEWS